MILTDSYNYALKIIGSNKSTVLKFSLKWIS